MTAGKWRWSTVKNVGCRGTASRRGTLASKNARCTTRGTTTLPIKPVDRFCERPTLVDETQDGKLSSYGWCTNTGPQILYAVGKLNAQQPVSLSCLVSEVACFSINPLTQISDRATSHHLQGIGTHDASAILTIIISHLQESIIRA